VTPSIRAHRILRPLARYVPADDPRAASQPPHGQLGLLLGIYCNPNPEENVRFYEKGLVWGDRSGDRTLGYAEIKAATAPHDQRSMSIEPTTVGGTSHEVPVKGHRDGNTFDSLEVLRFFLRVIGDQLRVAKSH
jgi:hypothetical protein